MKNLPDVTLVCVETRFPELALFAIAQSTRGLRFKEIILFSAERVSAPGIELTNIVIPPLRSTEEYSEFVIKSLPDHITSDFALIIQWDGFVIDSESWDEEFKNYDYIGAPWNHRPVKVGNGGFSLRSKKLLRAAQAIEMESCHPEDRCICETYAPILEREFGVVFSPEELAARFSFEHDPSTDPTFGFHGVFNAHAALHGQDLSDYLAKLPKSIALSQDVRKLVKNLYQSGHYGPALSLIGRRLVAPAPISRDALVLAIRCLSHGLFHGLIRRRQRA